MLGPVDDGYRLRPAKRTDADDLGRLAELLGHDVSAGAVETHLELVADTPHDGTIIVADLEGAVVGWIEIRRERALTLARSSAVVTALAVDAGHRGRGVGTALVLGAEAWAREHGIEQVRVRSRTERTGAHEFFRARSFELYKTQAVFRRTLESSDAARRGPTPPRPRAL
jgi:N-acetylglutamate synthase-like GNAT family acetyltransferase